MQKLLDSPSQTLSNPSALTPIGQVHQSLPSPVPEDVGRYPSDCFTQLEHREMSGQAQGRSGGYPRSSENRRHQVSFLNYLRANGLFSISQCATGPARERTVCPRRSWME